MRKGLIKKDVLNRTLEESREIIDTDCTTRELALKFNVSQNTICRDLNKILPKCESLMFDKVREILERHKEEAPERMRAARSL